MHTEEWVTIIGHPASGTRYQEVGSEVGVWGRVTQDGKEVVSPSTDCDSVYAQYRARVNRAIAEDN